MLFFGIGNYLFSFKVSFLLKFSEVCEEKFLKLFDLFFSLTSIFLADLNTLCFDDKDRCELLFRVLRD